MRYPQVKDRTVLVTGCSSGIGLATADLLRQRQWRVIATARRPEHLEHLKSLGLECVPLDLADSESVHAAAARVLELTGGSLGAIVNNAGYGQPGAVEDLSREMLRRQFEVNVFGLVELTNLFIPRFRQQGYGRIVNISSMVGRIALPFMGAYSASKFALEALSDAWRVELHGSGVAVSIIEPGPIATRFGANALRHMEELINKESSPFIEFYRAYSEQRRSGSRPSLFRLPPSDVARKIQHALESSPPKTRYPVTIPAIAANILRKVLPDRALDRLVMLHWQTELSRLKQTKQRQTG